VNAPGVVQEIPVLATAQPVARMYRVVVVLPRPTTACGPFTFQETRVLDTPLALPIAPRIGVRLPLVPLQLWSSVAENLRRLILGFCLSLSERVLSCAVKVRPFSLLDIVKAHMPALRCSKHKESDVLVG
jgi:hypothetical protein